MQKNSFTAADAKLEVTIQAPLGIIADIPTINRRVYPEDVLRDLLERVKADKPRIPLRTDSAQEVTIQTLTQDVIGEVTSVYLNDEKRLCLTIRIGAKYARSVTAMPKAADIVKMIKQHGIQFDFHICFELDVDNRTVVHIERILYVWMVPTPATAA